MRPLPKIDAIPVFKEIQEELIALLEDLSEEEWYIDTWSSQWNVKDVVAHLLDGDLRRLSLHRDKLDPPEPTGPIDDYNSLVDFLNKLNTTWVAASKRLSPELLIELTEFTTPRVVKHLNKLNPDGKALFSVAWAGENESTNRFDIAREYTEKWHHQQQIREAVGRPLLIKRKWLYPLIETLIRAVPVVYNRHAPDEKGRLVQIYISGVVDDSWLLKNLEEGWRLSKSDGENPDITIRMNEDTAWRLFCKNITEAEALKRITIDNENESELGNLITKTTSFMK